ncbi:MAG: MipA family protein [Betaproteobacteria bacterium]|jgi:outer membrane protein|nr:MipA family protein [Betaproteobacteria bacterium]
MKAILFMLALLPLAAAADDDYTLLGLGVRTRPDYDGSASRTVDLIPVVRYYGKPLFARTTQGMLEGGARYEFSPALQAGIQLAYEAGRDAVFGLPEVDWGASIGFHVESDLKVGPAPLNLLLRARRHLDSDRGSQVDLRSTLGVYGEGRTLAGVFVQATWASAKSMQSFYGVNDGGLLFTSAGLLASHGLAPKWDLVGSVELRRLSSDAMRSPIVEKRTGTYASAGVAYRF